MKFPATAALLLLATCLLTEASLRAAQPIVEKGRVDSDDNFAVSAQDGKPAR
eukprot:CAMPEP_0172707374 /NCGR_PEP_ID=MMETSP1074-20121228/49500_1 /TAXON_ID=2916 /ORGANISM="Ceratium fusus, Strain PA161109" /LENGTH=51 /DNA_ID=CAMNT_0013530177 /DNA_START=1 /DNA_END=152 /DNA_ORIENTATION=+